jgi:hypothetical protein
MHSVMCVKTMCVIYRRGDRATERRRAIHSLSPRPSSLAALDDDAKRTLAMAFILGGFSHLFAFKGAFQAEVRARDRRRRRRARTDDGWTDATHARTRRLTMTTATGVDAGDCG